MVLIVIALVLGALTLYDTWETITFTAELFYSEVSPRSEYYPGMWYPASFPRIGIPVWCPLLKWVHADWYGALLLGLNALLCALNIRDRRHRIVGTK